MAIYLYYKNMLTIEKFSGDIKVEKCACVVVTYFPDSSCLEHLNYLTKLCQRVVVVDNTPGEKQVSFPATRNLTVLRLGENRGLAFALNKGIRTAGAYGLENLFLLDQDSVVPEDYFSNMLRFKANTDLRYRNCAMYVPNFWDRNSHTFARFPVLTPFTIRHWTCENMRAVRTNEVLIAITSGTLITYSMYKKLGPLRDEYFIDFLDNEYCLRAGKMGLKIAVNCDVTLNHSIGKRTRHSLMGLPIKPNYHSPLRRYYIARNGLRTAIDYFAYYPSYSALIVIRLIHEIVSILIYEDKKLKKIHAFICGIYHGLINRMGKRQLEWSNSCNRDGGPQD